MANQSNNIVTPQEGDIIFAISENKKILFTQETIRRYKQSDPLTNEIMMILEKSKKERENGNSH